MVLPHGNAQSHTARMEQIITEFFAKSLHIILESRALNVSSRNGGDKSDSSLYSSSSPWPSVRPRDKWFNLALRECSAAFENINNLESLIIDVILVHRSLDRDPMVPKRVLPKSSSMKEFGIEAKSGKIVERWVVQYENRKIKHSNSGSGTRRSSNFSMQNLYKKLTDILSSLYAKVRLLPAYEIFNVLSSSAEIRPFTLAHRVCSFVEPFTLKEESEMMKYRFTPMDTSSGRLCLKVIYCPSTTNLIRNASLFPRVIPDYGGSPSADPSRKLPSFPLAGVPCHGSPSLWRRSSNFDDSKASSPSKSHISLPNSSSCIPKNAASIDDCCNPFPLPSIYLNSSLYTYRSTNVTAEKVFSLGNDEPQKYYGDRISANSLQRISTDRRSYRDDFDGSDYNCPFDVGYDDMKGPEGRKSNDAAVGKLVDMLRKARPLEISIASRKTTRDALEEFDDYMVMKNWLVSKAQI